MDKQGYTCRPGAPIRLRNLVFSQELRAIRGPEAPRDYSRLRAIQNVHVVLRGP
jgi:hypothetical protein